MLIASVFISLKSIFIYTITLVVVLCSWLHFYPLHLPHLFPDMVYILVTAASNPFPTFTTTVCKAVSDHLCNIM